MDHYIIIVNGHHVLIAVTFEGRWALTIDHVYAGTWCDAQTACYAAALELQRKRLMN